MMNKILSKISREGLLSAIKASIQYPFRFSFRKSYNNMLKKETIEKRFLEIYEKNLWSSDESNSGEGSELNYTKPLREWLIKTINELNINTFVDAPCGDFNWMRKIIPHLKIQYIGLDIVEPIIKRNIANYSDEHIKFKVADICKDKMPECDILMVRDCLFHLSYSDINAFLKNISNLKYSYLLTTTHINNTNFRNKDILSGDFRLIDLFQSPFNFNSETVIDSVDDYPKGHRIPRKMILVKKNDVPCRLK